MSPNGDQKNSLRTEKLYRKVDLHSNSPTMADTDGIGGLLKAWNLLEIDPEALPPPYQFTPNPYPGLRSFDPSESLLYFGRPGQDATLAARLEKHNVVGVLGGSGSGKSSLVLAGLLPYLKRFQRVPNRGGRWYLVHTRPGSNPTDAILNAIQESIIAPLPNRKFGLGALATAFGPAGLQSGLIGDELARDCGQILKRHLAPHVSVLDSKELLSFANKELQILDSVGSGGLQVEPANLLIVIDQFEEIFRKEVDPANAASVVELIKTVNRSRGQGLFVALTMRSEEMHRCAEYAGLSEILFASSIQVELLTKEDDIRAAIVEPARRVFDSWNIGYAKTGESASTAPFSVELVRFLTEQVQSLSGSLDHKPDSLPLLQHALRAIWRTALVRWGEQRQTDSFEPEIRLEDFSTRTDTAPLQSCLNKQADRARRKALAEISSQIEGENGQKEHAASRLVDMAFICLARMDDNNRWIRRWASAESIASEGVFEVEQSANNGSLLRSLTPGRSSRFHEIRVNREQLVSAALEVFRRNGYLFRHKNEFDVSHESLIRNWSHYQLILQEAKATREALIGADNAIGTFEARPHKGWVQHSISWLRGGKSKRAFEVLRGVNVSLLDRLFKSPRWLGAVWAKNQLTDEWRRRGVVPESSQCTDEEISLTEKRADYRFSEIRAFYENARAWSEWRGYRPPKRLQRFFAISSIPVLFSSVLGLAVALVFSTSELVTFLKDISSITDESATSDPITARKNLLPLLARAQTISDRDSIRNRALGLVISRGEKHPVDSATEILFQKTRHILKFATGKITNVDILDKTKTFGEVKCERARRISIAQILEFELTYGEPKGRLPGYGFFPRRLGGTTAPPPQTAPFADGDLVCVANDASLLLQIQPSGMVLYPLTLVTTPNGDRFVHFTEAFTVTIYDNNSQKAENFLTQSIIADLFSNKYRDAIVSFETTSIQGIKVLLTADRDDKKKEFLYITHFKGIKQPIPYDKFSGCKLFNDCKEIEGISKTFTKHVFTSIGDTTYYFDLTREIYRRESPVCNFDDAECPQRLSLVRHRQQSGGEGQENDNVVVFENTHVGLPIVDAKVNNGELLLLDTSGNIWKYIVGLGAFSDAVHEAGALTFPTAAE